MLSKKLLIFVGLLAAVAVTILMLDKKGSAPQNTNFATSIFNSNQVDKLSQITIVQKDKKLEISLKEKGKWVVNSDEGFPASAKKIDAFLQQLADAKVIRMVSLKKDGWAELELDKPDTISLKEEGKDKEQVIYLGKNRSNGGRYARIDETEAAYLIDGNLSLDTEAGNWIYKNLLDIKEKNLKAVSFNSASTPFELHREKAEDPFLLKGMTEKEKLKDSEVSQLKNIAHEISFTSKTKISEAYKSALAAAKPVDLETFDGIKYQVKIVVLETPKPVAATENPDSKADPKKVAPAPEMEKKYYVHIDSKEAAAADLKVLMDTWQFEISEYVANNFRKQRADFVQESKS